MACPVPALRRGKRGPCPRPRAPGGTALCLYSDILVILLNQTSERIIIVAVTLLIRRRLRWTRGPASAQPSVACDILHLLRPPLEICTGRTARGPTRPAGRALF